MMVTGTFISAWLGIARCRYQGFQSRCAATLRSHLADAVSDLIHTPCDGSIGVEGKAAEDVDEKLWSANPMTRENGGGAMRPETLTPGVPAD